MSYQELLGTCRVFLVAGSETTATLLSGAIFYLLQNPCAMSRLKREVRESFPSAEDITMRSVTTSGRLPYIEAVLQESFRCFPPVPSTLPRIILFSKELLTKSYYFRSLLMYTSGQLIVAATTSPIQTRLIQSGGYLRRPKNIGMITRLRFNHLHLAHANA
jgi:Cytochrome P450